MSQEKIRILSDPPDTGLFRMLSTRTAIESSLWRERLMGPGMIPDACAISLLYAESGPFALALRERTGLLLAAVTELDEHRDPDMKSRVVHWCCASYLGGGRYAWMDVRGLTDHEERFFDGFPGHRRILDGHTMISDEAFARHIMSRTARRDEIEAWLDTARAYIPMHPGRYLLATKGDTE